MRQERLSDLSVLSIKAENLEKLKMDDLINQFADKRREKYIFQLFD